MTMLQRERRSFDTEIEFRSGSGKAIGIIEGYAPVYDKMSRDLGGFVEVVRPGSATRSLKQDEQIGTFNHNIDWPLGRTGSGTMRVADSERGVHYAIDLPDTTYGRDVRELAERGDITQASFGFALGVTPDGLRGDSVSQTEQGYPLRELVAIRIFDMGPVTVPAYLDSDSRLRALEGLVTETRSLSDIAAALEQQRLKDLISGQGDEGSETRTLDDERLEIERERLRFLEHRFAI